MAFSTFDAIEEGETEIRADDNDEEQQENRIIRMKTNTNIRGFFMLIYYSKETDDENFGSCFDL